MSLTTIVSAIILLLLIPNFGKFLLALLTAYIAWKFIKWSMVLGGGLTLGIMIFQQLNI